MREEINQNPGGEKEEGVIKNEDIGYSYSITIVVVEDNVVVILR